MMIVSLVHLHLISLQPIFEFSVEMANALPVWDIYIYVLVVFIVCAI